MNTQYLYKFLLTVIIIGMSADKLEAKKHARNEASQDVAIINRHTHRCSEELSTSVTGSMTSIPCETHELYNIVPHDAFSSDLTATKPRSIQIRVLLDESLDNPLWVFNSSYGFWLLDPTNMQHKISIDESSLSLSSRSGFIFINGKRLTKDKVIIKAKQGDITYNGRVYQGSLYVICMSGKILLINCVDLEDYVSCVLNSEAWPGWPLEMNKVLAIAIRTYGVAMMREAADMKRAYHVKNSVAHQVYAGTHNKKILHDAVAQTTGIIMAYHKKPIISMYDACCGGVITSRIKGINFQQAPYLARNYSCTYCKSCKIFSWTAEFSKDELTAMLKPYIPNLSKIKSIQISKKDGAGLVREVSVKSAHGITALSGKKIYGLPKIKSFYYSIQNTPTKIIFKGRGYGHHVGLCQWGACQMVRDGLDYKAVLRFYYPGITFMKIIK